MTNLLRLDRDNPNTFIGVILLVVLGVFVLPDRVPQFIADLSPYLFAGVPCERLPAASNLAAHQSVLGRSAVDPLKLELSASGIGDENELVIRLSVTNGSLGTVPVVFQADNIVVAAADDATDGFGLVIDPPPATGIHERSEPNPTSYDEGDIRLLGPRQTCVHAFELEASAAMITDGGSARARYRMSVVGEQQEQGEGTGQIYADQGLDILADGVVYSEEIEIGART